MDTIESDIGKLNARKPNCSLARLEADVWAGVAVRTRTRQAGRLILSCQAALMAIALMGSIAAGAFTAALAANPPQAFSSFSSRTTLAPSTLLLGSHP